MVDCGNPRCAQERRFFKKELLSWSKKVPLMIALEQIAGSYCDKENSRQLANPYTTLEGRQTADDWEADISCFYCQGQLTNALDHLDEVLKEVKQGTLDGDSAYVRPLQDLLPFCIKYYTHGIGRELLVELGAKSSYSSTCAAATQVSTISSTQTPLDAEEAESAGLGSLRSHVELKIPYILQGQGGKGEIHSAGGIKRGYTEEELDAAVADIKGGKLGTRRASNLYGIPRSTLRNKIYRSGVHMDRVPAFLDPEDSNSGDEAVAVAVTGSMKMAELMQAGLFPYLPPLPSSLPSAVKEEPDQSQAAILDEFSVKLGHIRRMHNLKGNRNLHIKPAHINELKLPLLTTLIRRLVEQRFQMEVSRGKGQGHDSRRNERERGSSPVTQERRSTAISVDTLPHFLPYLPAFSPSCLPLSVPSSLEDLRVPSYKPTNIQQQQEEAEAMDEDSRPFGKVYETSRIGETLKDIIVKSISEKMKFQDVDSHTPSFFSGASDLFSQTFSRTEALPVDLGKSAFRSCHSEISQPSHPAKRIKREPCNGQDGQSSASKSSRDGSKSKSSDGQGPSTREGKTSTQTASGSNSNAKNGGEGSVKEKKTRPKRGQYRKYNSQLLIEAVRAVQRGEMSVHRAGSYFGVPHSTLEYKVKERHLLRQKKPREGSSSSSAGASTTTSASASNTSSSIITSTSITSSSPSASSSPMTSSTTQTSKAALLTSTASSDSSASSISSSSQTQFSISGKAETSLPLSLSSSPASSLSALGFGLHKQAGVGSELPWFQPYLVSSASPSLFDPALSLFPQGFALNTSASELLRKLQHKVQSKSSPSSPFSSESSFGFAHPNSNSSVREGFLLYN